MTKSTRSKGLICRFCGTEFPANRSDKQFCCDNHRKAYSRWTIRLSAHEVRANSVIHAVAEYMAYPESKQTAVSVLKSVDRLINVILDEQKQSEG